MNIVLVGYRGTGKSAVAHQLAEVFGLRVVSLDQEIERQTGSTIPEIVDQRGWSGFRDLETEVVSAAAARDGQIIDCGGGVIEREANFDLLRAAGQVVWLRASTDTIVQRIGGDTQRPSLTGVKSFTDEVDEVLERRTPLYERIAHLQVDTDDRTIEEVATAVQNLLAG